jgi:hypothetical protein
MFSAHRMESARTFDCACPLVENEWTGCAQDDNLIKRSDDRPLVSHHTFHSRRFELIAFLPTHQSR